MRIRCYAALNSILFAVALTALPAAHAQMTHAQAKAQVEARDARHHNKLKTEAIPTAGGAVGGGVVGGPAGAFAGAKIGHGIGTGFHAIKKHHDIKQVEKHGTPRHRVVRSVRSTRSTPTVRRRTAG